MHAMPSEAVVDAWVQLMRAHRAALAGVEAELKAAGLPQIAWYDVLWALERCQGPGLRPFELESQLLVPQYGISRLVERMAAAGLVERRPCPQDGRGQVVAITEAGLATRRRMWPVYGRAIQQMVGAALGEVEAAQLAAGLGRLLGRAGDVKS